MKNIKSARSQQENGQQQQQLGKGHTLKLIGKVPALGASLIRAPK